MNSQLHVSTHWWRVCPSVINRQSYRGLRPQPSRVEKLQFKWKTGTCTNVSNQYTTPGHRMWSLEGKATAQEAAELETYPMNKWRQAAGNKELLTYTHCLFPAESYTSLPSIPPTSAVPLHFHSLYRTWCSIDHWKVWHYYISILSFFSLFRFLLFFL